MQPNKSLVPIPIILKFIKDNKYSENFTKEQKEYIMELMTFWAWIYVKNQYCFNEKDVFYLKKFSFWNKKVELFRSNENLIINFPQIKPNEWEFLGLKQMDVSHLRPDEIYMSHSKIHLITHSQWEILEKYMDEHQDVPKKDDEIYTYYIELRSDFFTYTEVSEMGQKFADKLIEIGKLPTKEEWIFLEPEWRVKFVKGFCENNVRRIQPYDSKFIYNYLYKISSYLKTNRSQFLDKTEIELNDWLNENFPIKRTRETENTSSKKPRLSPSIMELSEIATDLLIEKNKNESTFEEKCYIVGWYLDKFNVIPRIYKNWFEISLTLFSLGKFNGSELFIHIIQKAKNMKIVNDIDEETENAIIGMEFLKTYKRIPKEIDFVNN